MFRTLLLLVFCCGSFFSAAQPNVSHGSIKRLENFPSTLVSPRAIDIWLPNGFSPKQKYAVLYMHDGQMLFDASTNWNKQEWRVDEVAQQQINSGKVRPFIVVGIHNADQNRHAEYFPQQPFASLPAAQQQAFYQLERQPGQKLFQRAVYSDAYLKFLVTELKPYIDRHFPVLSDRSNTFVMGSSMGGLISMYALSEYPQVFGGAACLSTHWPGIMPTPDNPVPAAFLRYMQSHLPKPGQHKLYFDYGDQTLDAFYPPLQQQVDKLMTQLQYPSSLWQSRFFKGAEHSEQAWAQRLDIPLQFLLTPSP
jgi:enterochelin esterase-like enzyme